jgi:actin-related protein 3
MTFAKLFKERDCKVAKYRSDGFFMFEKVRCKYSLTYKAKNSETGKEYPHEVGYERILTPEVWFSLELLSSDDTTTTSYLIDRAVQLSPVDY